MPQAGAQSPFGPGAGLDNPGATGRPSGTHQVRRVAIQAEPQAWTGGDGCQLLVRDKREPLVESQVGRGSVSTIDLLVAR
jgi:hypothetical protein